MVSMLKTSPYEIMPPNRQVDENKQNFAISCSNYELREEEYAGKLAENRIPLEYLDKRTLVMQFKALEEYVWRLLKMIKQPDKEAQLNVKQSFQENCVEAETEDDAKVKRPENKKSGKRKRKKRNKARKANADKYHVEMNLVPEDKEAKRVASQLKMCAFLDDGMNKITMT